MHGRTARLVAGRAPASTATRRWRCSRRVGMDANADRPCATLAYGDVKRVELAIALAERAEAAADGRADRRHGAARARRADGAHRRRSPASAASACCSPSTTWTRSSPMPTASSCWCAARSSPPARRRRCAPNARVREVYLGDSGAAPPRGARPGGHGASALLEVEGLSAFYGRAQILFDVVARARRAARSSR